MFFKGPGVGIKAKISDLAPDPNSLKGLTTTKTFPFSYLKNKNRKHFLAHKT